MIGNFLHAPNRDSVHWVKRELWPKIRNKMPRAEIHVYGAYPAKQDFELHDPRNGFYLKGSTDDSVKEILSRYRVLLAPLRFGAGIKGKILDAWSTRTAVVTSPIGAEGMIPSDSDFPGTVLSLEAQEAWAQEIFRLHETEADWSKPTQAGLTALREEYSCQEWQQGFLKTMESALGCEKEPELLQEVLNAEGVHSKRYLSKYIELKEKLSSKFPGGL
jgi:hypothetical protein